jgi:hypothetical protein
MDLNKHMKKCRFISAMEERREFMSSYEGETFLKKSTFLPPVHVNNLSDAEKLFEEWIHSQDSNDIRRYKSLMLPPKNMNQMIVDARLRNQEEENEICENGFDFDVNIPIQTNNPSNIGNGTLQTGMNQQSHENSESIFDNDGMVDIRNGIKSRHNMIRYTPDLAFQVHLLSVITNVRGVPLNMFDKIMDVIFVHCVQRNFDFNNSFFSSTRKGLINRLKKIHGMSAFKAKLVGLTRRDGTSIGVVVFDTMEVLTTMFEDERIVCPANIAKGYNFWDGTVVDLNVYGEIPTGDSWNPTRDAYIGNDPDKLPVPLVGFYDKTHTDDKGILATAPFLITFAFLNLETRKRSYASFPLGLVPNLNHGRGSRKTSCPNDTFDHLQDEHDCLQAILQDIIDIHSKGGVRRTIFGKEKNLIIWFHIIIGDIQGNNNLAAAYQNSGLRPYRLCKCTHDDLDAESLSCEYVTIAEFQQYKLQSSDLSRTAARDVMKQISRHGIDTVWEKGVPLADMIHGINLITPPEMLHTVGVGIAVYIIAVIKDCLNDSTRTELDFLYIDLYHDLKRNCDHDYYESSLHKGATETVKQGALENIGHLLSLAALCTTDAGINLLDKKIDGAHPSLIQHTLIHLLASVVWLHSDNNKEDVRKSEAAFGKVLSDIKNIFPRPCGNSWKIPKVHGYMLMQRYVQMYGNASNFYGGWGERCHIEWIKDNGLRTQRQASTFNDQIGERICEGVILKTAEDTLVSDLSEQMDLLSISTTHLRNRFDDLTNPESSNVVNIPSKTVGKSFRGRYSVTVSVEDVIDEDQFGNAFVSDHTFCHSVTWKSDDKGKQCIGRRISFELEYFLVQRALSLHTSTVTVTGYTEAYIQFSNLPIRTVVRCTDNYRGQLWYDFVIVQRNDVILPGKVVGIIEVDGKIKFVIQLAIASNGFNGLESFHKNFFHHFVLGDKDHIRLHDLEDIVMPLIVYPNYGRDQKTEFISILPKRLWGKFFTEFINNSWL